MPKNDLVLQITSPAPLRPQGILLCTIALAILAFTVRKNADSLMALTMGAVATGALIVLFVFLAGAVLFKNIFGKEQLLFVKDGAPAGTAAATAIACGDLIAIECKPLPLPMTADGKLAMLGLGGERLMLVTRKEAIPFGIGLSGAAATAAIQQIEEFCGRSLLR
ncbi:hypothetical protein JOD97_003697 [Duganella sp. 1411]|uniref:hypothetical protein n=1 Tax=Duganella sp. 1411 TaxID=2806572 RepID=UPI001AE5B966|nr:hypothetical protein [Duganella sp. 1411]MBP1205635.1 hypothetical protein [Duganella sp. 1411]